MSAAVTSEGWPWALDYGEPVLERRPTCPQCGKAVDELCRSSAFDGLCCARCHCDAQPRRPAARAPRFKSPKPPVPTPYARLVAHVWRRIEELTGYPPMYPGVGRLDSYCPIGCGGVISITFVETPAGPEAIVSRPCTAGCTKDQVQWALS